MTRVAAGWRTRLTSRALAVPLAGATAMFVLRSSHHRWRTNDTKALLQGISTISWCIGRGTLFRCNALAVAHHRPSVSKFPLIQSAPAAALQILGVSVKDMRGDLGWLDTAAIAVASVVLVRWCFRRSGLQLAVLAGLLFVPGLALAYAAQTFSEPLSVLAFVGLVLAGLRQDRASSLLLGAAVAATVTKETAAPFVVVFGLAAIALSGAPSETTRAACRRLFAGVATGLVLSTGFNLFRYGTVLNGPYFREPRSTPVMVPVNAAALLISPNGGLAWFWPGAAVALGVLVLALVRRPSVGAPGLIDPRRVRMAAALTLGGFAAYTVSLGAWWDPFGWSAWGPRLQLPAAAPVIVLALATMAARSAPPTLLPPTLLPPALLPSTPLPARLLVSVAGAAIVVLFPTLGIVFGMGSETSMILATTNYRPACLQNRLPGDALYESCQRTEEWRPAGNPLERAWPSAFGPHLHPEYWITVLLADAAILAATQLALNEGQRPGSALAEIPVPAARGAMAGRVQG